MKVLSNILQLFLPRRCAICHKTLGPDEEGICLLCQAQLPRIHFDQATLLELEQVFWGKIPFSHVAAYCYYQKGNSTATLVHQLKYRGRKDLGIFMGKLMANELKHQDFFKDIEIIIPVPLHPRKERERGYNQAYCLALGIAAITGLPIERYALKRLHYTLTQTHKSANERWNNVDGVFTLPHPEQWAYRHVLLIDDVLTTGATLTACADAFKGVPGIRISILTFGRAH